ncbi:MAG: polyphosphate kinase 2 family protein [Akkermansiaceae bacterium]|nr:polyphosphate kinase 2 family protein [Verrucomicrobiales bacterium]
MKIENVVQQARKISRPYAVTAGSKFDLKKVDPGDTGAMKSENKAEAEAILKAGVEVLSELQERLYAQDQWAVLLIFQAMDAAGKDSAIKHALSGVNPQGCEVTAFKAPSTEELDHDFLWRCQKRLPERGRIGIFNRSYYEEVLIVRVHPEMLERQKLPPPLLNKNIWEQRFKDIRAFEKHLGNNGVLIRKFFLHVSPAEQKQRFLKRLDQPDKNWKFSAQDVKERAYWKDYMRAYEAMVRETSTPEAPWYVVPADHKWFTRVVVASAIIDALDSLKLSYPAVDPARQKELALARKALAAS